MSNDKPRTLVAVGFRLCYAASVREFFIWLWSRLTAPPKCMACGADLSDDNIAGEGDACARCWARFI